MSINVDLTEEQLINFLKIKLNIKEDILKRIKEEKIDGEALILLRKKDFKYLGIGLGEKNKILKYTEKDLIKMKKNFQDDTLYRKILNLTSKPWDYLEAIISQLKLGDKLKFIKYTFIINQPPSITKPKELFQYLKTFLKIEENTINQIIEIVNDILTYTEDIFDEQCQLLDIKDEDEIFKLKIVIELVKNNNIKNNEKNKDNSLENFNTPKDVKVIENLIKSGKKLIFNHDLILTKKNRDEIDSNIFDQVSLKNDYNIYSMIKTYDYKTSQGEITTGLINPINEFQKLCSDFEIEHQDECTFINYNQGFKIKISTAMLWGTKEGLLQFFYDKGIGNAKEYFAQNELFSLCFFPLS